MAKFDELFPQTSVSKLTLTLTGTGGQSAKIVNRHVAVAILDPGSSTMLPFHAPLLSVRAKAGEGLRLRCLSCACPHRPALETKELLGQERKSEAEELVKEIAPDDREEKDETQFQEDDADGVDGNVVANQDIVQELWTHSSPVAFWSGLLDTVGVSTCHVVLGATTSGHPGLILATRAKGLPLHLLVDRVTPHCLNHGKALAEKYWLLVSGTVSLNFSVFIMSYILFSLVLENVRPTLARLNELHANSQIKRPRTVSELPLIQGPTFLPEAPVFVKHYYNRQKIEGLRA